MAEIVFSNNAEKAYKRLPLVIKKKADKQLQILLKNPRHPSLRYKKMAGREETFEARIDRHYRLAFSIEEKIIYIHSLGSHDTGLGKK